MPASNLTDGMSELTTTWSALTNGVLRGECAFWLGSGISRDKFPDVPALVIEVLKQLHSSSNITDPDCPYQKALTDIMQLTTIRDLPVTDAPDTWPDARKNELIQLLSDKYADVLEQDVRSGTRTILITWDLLRLQDKYGDPTKTPDAEHRFIALLIEEGIISELVTTNWDALVELAHEECRNGKSHTLQSVACTNELNRNGFRSKRVSNINATLQIDDSIGATECS
jgi:hypothetical protein